jgi:LacI family transcriptional regulator
MSTQSPTKIGILPDDTVTTLEMVASAAQVSPSTVSRFLNGTAKVSEAKRFAIEAAIQKLNFVSNPIASGLAGGKTRSIGVVTQVLGSPYYGQAMVGVEDVLMAANYAPLFVSSHWKEDIEMRCINFLEGRRVDGIIILTACLTDEVLIKRSIRTPIVVTSRNISSDRLFSLNFDNFTGAKMATEHLIELGHTRIAFIKGTSSHPDAIQRFKGYRAALKEHGISYDARLAVQGHFLETGGETATQLLLQSGANFTAIFAANDQMAYGAALALYNRGLRIPDDISLVGFDDLLTSSITLPPLTTVSLGEIGKIAAQTMTQLIGLKSPAPTIPPPRLIIRKSTQHLSGPRVSG